jgi:uncharacterized protein with von Willebrand factor type A (vWA) domain
MLEVKGHNVIVGIDRSGSMDTRDCEGQTRYQYLGEKLVAFVAAAVESASNNQVTALFFSNEVKQSTLKSGADAEAALRLYHTGGGTATHTALEAAYKYAQQTPDVPAMFFLATDGIPDSEDAVDKEIVSITKRIKNPEDFRVMILTVGQRSPHITKWLEHLDADLGGLGAQYDIVGQNNLNEVNFQEAAAELIKSTTTNDEAAVGAVQGKKTERID